MSKEVNSITISKSNSDLQNRFDYDSNDNCIYLGEAPKGYSTSDKWFIIEYTWIAGNVSGFNCTTKKTAIGSWADRASLSYT